VTSPVADSVGHYLVTSLFHLLRTVLVNVIPANLKNQILGTRELWIKPHPLPQPLNHKGNRSSSFPRPKYKVHVSLYKHDITPHYYIIKEISLAPLEAKV